MRAETVDREDDSASFRQTEVGFVAEAQIFLESRLVFRAPELRGFSALPPVQLDNAGAPDHGQPTTYAYCQARHHEVWWR